MQVRVIAQRTLDDFVNNRVEPALRRSVKSSLDAWYREVDKADWNSSAQLKRDVGAASIVTSERVVFNIKGNEYRLVAAVDYRGKIVLVIWLGTHREYDRIVVEEVQYDRTRYRNSSDSN